MGHQFFFEDRTFCRLYDCCLLKMYGKFGCFGWLNAEICWKMVNIADISSTVVVYRVNMNRLNFYHGK